MPSVQFMCLANSRKPGGRCVAGLRIDGTGWFRPVTNHPDGTVWATECILPDGTDTNLLDVVEVDVTRHRPEPHQPENWELAATPWRLVQRVPAASALQLLASWLVPGPVLLEDQSDRLNHAAVLARPVAASLALIEPRSIQWNITTNFRGNRQTRCRFDLAGATYDLSVTDMRIEHQLGALPFGLHPRDTAGIAPTSRVFLTVSLSEPLPATGQCYKLVAAVLVFP
jgi:hypothetical protein